MAILTDDCDISTTHFWMEYGGNGDYYINLMQAQDGLLRFSRLSTRFAMSGGTAPTEVKLAIANLYRAMETAGLNSHPKDDPQ
jgi:hypothetical protein